MSLKLLVNNAPWEALWTHADALSDEQLHHCAKIRPDIALVKAAHRLILHPALFQLCIEHAAGVALEWVLSALNDAQFEALVRKEPLVALARAHNRLSPELRKFCIIAEPGGALGDFMLLDDIRAWSSTSYPCRKGLVGTTPKIALLLNDFVYNYCVTHAPRSALRFALDRLDHIQFNYCLHKEPGPALEFASSRLSDRQFAFLVKRDPASAMRFCSSRLTPTQVLRCADRSPGQALYSIWRKLPAWALRKAANKAERTVVSLLEPTAVWQQDDEPDIPLAYALLKLYEHLTPLLQKTVRYAIARTP